MPRIDIHQHLWPEDVMLELERRSDPPHARWASGCWTVALEDEPAFPVDPADHDLDERARAVRLGGLDRALVALSSPVGIEALAAADAAPLLAAWQDATARLPEALGAWAATSLADPDPAMVAAALDAGAEGLCLPAGAVATAAGLDRLAPLLSLLEDRAAPLFLHPGPAPPSARGALVPGWWAPSTAYVAETHAAWHAFMAWGRPAHPRLRVVFALLAGLAPLHAERVAGRGGPSPEAPDPLVFYDVSSYGPQAVRSMACAVGSGQLVHGTDFPVLSGTDGAAALGPDVAALTRTDNVARLLGRTWVPA